MRLINGRGQLGEALARLSVPDDVIVYHTWNCDDKSEEAQRACYARFVKFRQENIGRIVLISTSSSNDTSYVAYKRMAEEFADGVVRLPTLIGRGICHRFRDDESTIAFGTMELMSIEDAATVIANYVGHNATGVFTPLGIKIPARMVKDLIRFGAA